MTLIGCSQEGETAVTAINHLSNCRSAYQLFTGEVEPEARAGQRWPWKPEPSICPISLEYRNKQSWYGHIRLSKRKSPNFSFRRFCLKTLTRSLVWPVQHRPVRASIYRPLLQIARAITPIPEVAPVITFSPSYPLYLIYQIPTIS